jgi:ABC-2 type transport system ATP-binding protein
VTDVATRLPAHPPSAAPAAPTVELSGVDRCFGEIEAVSGLDLVVGAGAITVLLGPNGAGKTTALRMMTGTLDADRGTVRTFGLDPVSEGESVRSRTGVVSAKPSLYDRLTGLANLRYAAALYSVDDPADRIADAAGRFGIDQALHLSVGGYSTGMKTRLALARAILHDPDLLLLDEPTSGLDPESSYSVLALIRELTDGGRTVVMCTHLLAEAEGLADHVVMLEDGHSLMAGSQHELISHYWTRPAVTVDALDGLTVETLADLGFVATATARGVRVEVDSTDDIADLNALLVGAGVRVTRLDPEKPSLEDLYFRVRRDRAAQLAGATPS